MAVDFSAIFESTDALNALNQSDLTALLNSIDSSLKVIVALEIYKMKTDMDSMMRLNQMIKVFDGLLSKDEKWTKDETK